MLKRVIVIALICIATQVKANKPISGKTEKEFAAKILKLIREIDGNPSSILDQYVSYQEFSKFLNHSIKDKEHKLQKEFNALDPTKYAEYPARTLKQIQLKILDEKLNCKNASNPFIEERKRHFDGIWREGTLHFTIDSRKASIKLNYFLYKRKLYLLSLNRFTIQYKKVFVPPIAFTSTFWNFLPPKMPTDRLFYYPEVNSYQSDKSDDNVTIIINNSPKVDSVLHAHKNIGNSPTYKVTDLKQDSLINSRILILNDQDTLFASTIEVKLKKYKLDDFINWIPISLSFEETQSDSVVYKVSSSPICSLRGNHIFFDNRLDLEFGQYSSSTKVHNGARTSISLEYNFSNKSGNLFFELASEKISEFSNKILKKIFQVDGQLIVLVIKNNG